MNSLFASLHGEKIIGSTVGVRKERKRRGVLWVDAVADMQACTEEMKRLQSRRR